MPDLLLKVDEVKRKLANLKRKEMRVMAGKDFRRVPGMWKAVAAAESELDRLQSYVIALMDQQPPPPPAPDLRKSYSYDRFEREINKRSNKYG